MFVALALTASARAPPGVDGTDAPCDNRRADLSSQRFASSSSALAVVAFYSAGPMSVRFCLQIPRVLALFESASRAPTARLTLPWTTIPATVPGSTQPANLKPPAHAARLAIASARILLLIAIGILHRQGAFTAANVPSLQSFC